MGHLLNPSLLPAASHKEVSYTQYSFYIHVGNAFLGNRYEVKCKMFADDMKTYRPTKEEDHLVLQSAINAVARWSFPLPVQKSNVLLLGQQRNRKACFLDYSELGSSTRLREFILDTKLSFEDHCETIAKKTARAFSALKSKKRSCERFSAVSCCSFFPEESAGIAQILDRE